MDAPFMVLLMIKKDAFIYRSLDDRNLVPQSMDYTTNFILYGFNTHRLKDKELIRIMGEEINLISGSGDVKEILKEFKLNINTINSI